MKVTFKNFIIVFTIILITLIELSCNNKLPNNSEIPPDNGEPVIPVEPVSPYDEPAWSMDGKIIVFRRMKVTEINSLGGYQFDPDSTGIWAINADGTQMRLLLKGVNLHFPQLSPDNRWLVFEMNGQIYKAALNENPDKMTDIVQLTNEGQNYFPAWNADGAWIAYDSNFGDSTGANVIWKMRSDGSGKADISQHGVGEWRMPDWSPDGRSIVHQRYVDDTDAPEIVVLSISTTITKKQRLIMEPCG